MTALLSASGNPVATWLMAIISGSSIGRPHTLSFTLFHSRDLPALMTPITRHRALWTASSKWYNEVVPQMGKREAAAAACYLYSETSVELLSVWLMLIEANSTKFDPFYKWQPPEHHRGTVRFFLETDATQAASSGCCKPMPTWPANGGQEVVQP